jgi:hypothetical protein
MGSSGVDVTRYDFKSSLVRGVVLRVTQTYGRNYTVVLVDLLVVQPLLLLPEPWVAPAIPLVE